MTPQAIEVEKAGNPYSAPGGCGRCLPLFRPQPRSRRSCAAGRRIARFCCTRNQARQLRCSTLSRSPVDRGFEVVTARGKGRDTARPGAGNIYALNAAGCWEETPPHSGRDAGLASAAQRRVRRRPSPGRYLRPVRGTFHRLSRTMAGRAEFFNQLDEAMTVDPSLRVLLAMREDFVAQIDAAAAGVPHPLRLEQLRFEAALSAVHLLQGTWISFKPGVAELLVERSSEDAGHSVRFLVASSPAPGVCDPTKPCW